MENKEIPHKESKVLAQSPLIMDISKKRTHKTRIFWYILFEDNFGKRKDGSDDILYRITIHSFKSQTEYDLEKINLMIELANDDNISKVLYGSSRSLKSINKIWKDAETNIRQYRDKFKALDPEMFSIEKIEQTINFLNKYRE
jgi:hypothetical protein